MALNDVLLQALSGISRGMILFILASGLTLIFGVLRVANFAHGSLYMLASFTTYSVGVIVGDRNFGFLVALLVAPVLVALVGAAIEVLLLRPIANREHHYQLILTYGLTLILFDLVKLIWGRDFRNVDRPTILEGGVPLLGRTFPTYYILLIVAGGVSAALLWLLVNRTRLGRTMRAAAHDREMASALGINVLLVNTMVFAFGAWLGGLGGVLAAPVGSTALGMDSSIIIESFAVVIIGGVGQVMGALLGALVIGTVHSLGILFVPDMAIAFIFITMCVVLIVRPQGLIPRRI